MENCDVIIVGGGPAGMSAALILARCRRKVILFDTAKQRNRMSEAMHGYLTRDGINPNEFLELARKELATYGVIIRFVEIDLAIKEQDCFVVTDRKNKQYRSRKLLLATGVVDKVPQIEGIDEMYGKSVHHCPYCDGWEVRDKRIAVYGRGKSGYNFAKNLLNWSNDISLFTDGGKRPNAQQTEELQKLGIAIYTGKILRLEGSGAQLERIILKSGYCIERDAMFFGTGFAQHSILGRDLKCNYNAKNEIRVNHVQESSVKGLFVSGDAAYEMKLVIIAAGEGAKAGVAINVQLLEEDDEVRMKNL